MLVLQRLRRLDNHVIGPLTRHPPRVLARRCCLLGLGSSLTLVGLSIGARDPAVLFGLPGLVGLTIASGVQWWNLVRRPDNPTRGVTLAWLAAVALSAVAGALVVGSVLHARHPVRLPGPAPLRQPTMVVLCPATATGDAYTYQTVATATPTCNNAATPKIVVRG